MGQARRSISPCSIALALVCLAVAPQPQALSLTSCGYTGAINFLFCLPAMRTIDTFGRRTWLLATLPIMGILLAGAAGAFPLDDSTVVSTRVAAGISLILSETSLRYFMFLD
jgi:hypothetical protein